MPNKSFTKKGKRKAPHKEKAEFDKSILDLARVTRVTKGGKHLSFRALVVAGDRKGRVGFGVDKGKDVQLGVEKATRQAEKRMIKVPIINETIPHDVVCKYKAAVVLLKPAPRGSGIIAGGAVRVVLDLAGVPNASSKILGHTKNKIAIVKATFGALEQLFTHKKPGSEKSQSEEMKKNDKGLKPKKETKETVEDAAETQQVEKVKNTKK